MRIKFVTIFLAGLLIVSASTISAQEKPNIIFIMADDLGYGEIEPYGQQSIKTPNLTRMAREGMKFTNHYAGTSVCAPSRCALMTGLHTGHCEVRGNLQAPGGGQTPISDEAVTVAELLKPAGYKTAMIGKWGLGEPGTSGDPNQQGFDFFYGYTDQVLAHNHFPEFLLRNDKREYLSNKVNYLNSGGWHGGRGSVTIERKEFADELFTQEALKFISDNQSNSFFLYLPYIIPHDNGEAPEGFQYEAPSQREYAKTNWTKDEKDYAASISYLDDYVGQILDHLKKLNLDKNTLVIFTSDNGPKTNAMRFNSSGGLRGIKRDLYEGGSRIPFIAWWPGEVEANSTTNHISAFWDFLPTACELAGAKQRVRTDGLSYVPTLLGKGNQQKHDYLYFEFHEQTGSQAVRKENWKAVRRDIKTKNPQAIELYNLESDPEEKNNLAETYTEKVKEMEAIMSEAHSPSQLFVLPSGNK